MRSHTATTKDAPEKPEINDTCRVCMELRTQARPMHVCQYCKTAVCNLSCSIQDPQFPDNEMKWVHKKGKGCWIKNPSDELKVKCHKCQELFRGRDFKAHIKLKHSSLIKTSSIKCFECEYEADNLEKFKIHSKVHYIDVHSAGTK